jgi:chromosomal replication initiator protein
MDLKDLWLAAIKKISETTPRSQVITWFRNSAILTKENGKVLIGLPLPFYLGWHETHFSKITLEALQSLDGGIQSIAYQVDISLNENSPKVVDLIKHFPEDKGRKLPRKNETRTKDGIVSKMFNPAYSLENYITSTENRLAHAACQNVAKYPGFNYNPLFLHGGVGLGKTHLLQATGLEILKNDPSRYVLYTTTESFINEVIKCIQGKNMDYFRNKYRKVDALIIDDIQFIANKERTQEEFFHTFNALYESGKQVIISSDRPPSELTLLNDRLVSRFESGMIVKVSMPDYETRLAILQDKVRKAQVFINQDVLDFIAFNVSSSVRALEGILKRIIAQYELEHVSPTVKSVSEMLRATQKEVKMIGFTPADIAEPVQAVTLDHLIDSVSEYFSVPKSEVIGASRMAEYKLPRQVIMYLASTKLHLPFARIGHALGSRNHTTVMHSVKKLQSQIRNDRQLLRDVNAITKEVGIH